MSSKIDHSRLLRTHDLPDGPRHKEDSLCVDPQDAIIVIFISLFERDIGSNIHLRYLSVNILGFQYAPVW